MPIFPSYSCNDSLASLISPPTFAPLCIALLSVNYEWKGLIKHGRTPLFSSFRFNPLSREGRKGSDAKYHCQPQRFRQIVRHSAFRLPPTLIPLFRNAPLRGFPWQKFTTTTNVSSIFCTVLFTRSSYIAIRCGRGCNPISHSGDVKEGNKRDGSLAFSFDSKFPGCSTTDTNSIERGLAVRFTVISAPLYRRSDRSLPCLLANDTRLSHQYLSPSGSTIDHPLAASKTEISTNNRGR